MADFLTRASRLRVADASVGSYSVSSAPIRAVKPSTNSSRIPPYLHRQGFVPRCEEDFGGGGAYPEIFVAQFPLGMGKPADGGGNNSTLPLQLGADGRLEYDLVVRQGSTKTVVYTRPENADGVQLQGAAAVAARQLPRKLTLQDQQDWKIPPCVSNWKNQKGYTIPLDKRVAADGRNLQDVSVNDKFASLSEALYIAERQAREEIRLRNEVKKQKKIREEELREQQLRQLAAQARAERSSTEGVEGHNSGCAQRLLRLEDLAVDPLEPPRFKHKRVPAARFSPPPPVLHSPTRKLTLQDQQDWKIPPCVSNWKNQKGYTIPLDKRVAADGRNLQDVSVNDKFASLSEALYIAERQAREEIRLRNEVKKQKKIREEELREQQLRQLAAQARAERAQLLQQSRRAAGADAEEEAERQQREQLAREREKDIERAVRLERSRGKRRDDSQRDISEMVALGLPVDAKKQRTDSMFDARLFNQAGGTDSGYKGGEDDTYNLYDRPLFAQRGGAGIYQFSRDRFSASVG
ncbi:uncharacterized protein EMH_0005960 [Eimeria mitis]|uniref:SKI-interacting protein SKIP SNW domain-containing protein n=1 Tax=Eimeria mitis TaxID=44415 RepID=U6K3A9_9EIME|nr:uncharacterized protein EMH_0005960 [Eimeria mitis]CDJ30253.1 hypothetical protein, conserved [Eimeria mitis]